MRILVVDDDRAMMRITSLALEKKGGHEVICLHEGAEVPAAARREKPDLILLDMQMPEMSGIEVCSRLKSDDETKDIPVIFLTASLENSSPESFREHGALGLIKKPFKPVQLSCDIEKILKDAG